MGRGGGQVVTVLAFYSDDLSSNPTEKNKNKQKGAGVGPFKKHIAKDTKTSSELTK